MEEGMSSMQQKAAELEHMAEVLLTGEQLRYRNMVVFLGKVICRYKIIMAHPVKLPMDIPS